MDDNPLRQSTGDKNPEQYLDTELDELEAEMDLLDKQSMDQYDRIHRRLEEMERSSKHQFIRLMVLLPLIIACGFTLIGLMIIPGR